MSYYVTNENSFLDIKNAHLRVTGNVHTDVMKLGAIEFQPTGSEVTGTVNFTNVTTGVTTSSNLNVGGTLQLGTVEVVATTHTLANTTAKGNVTPHTIEVSNVTTGLVTTANVEVGRDLVVTGNVSAGKDLTVTGNVAVDTDTLFIDSVNDRVGIGTTSPDAKLNIQGTSEGAPPTSGGEGTSNGIFRLRDNFNVALDIGTLGASPWSTWLQVADTTTMGVEYPLSLNPNGGNVGIGTTNPDRKLHVKYDTSSWDNTTGAAVIIEDPGSTGAGITLKPTGSGVTNGTDGWALYAGSTGGGVGDGNIGFWAHGTNKAPFRVHRNGNIILLDSPSTGEVIVGDTSTTYNPSSMGTAVTSTPTNPILHVNGSIQLKSDNDAIVIGNGNATFLKDEELHFGWGGGWYMNDNNLLRVVNNKKIYSTGAAAFGTQLLLDVYGDNNSTSCLFIGTNTASQNLRIGVDSTGNNCWIQSHAGKPLRLNPAGNAIQYGTSNTVLSDDRIKDNETYIENATDTLIKLKPQIYDKKLIWNISKLDETSNISVVRESGLITQDVWYDAPELRHLVRLGEGAEPADDKPYTDSDPTKDPDYSSWGDNVSLLEYVGLIPYLIKSIQELQERIKTLETPPQ